MATTALTGTINDIIFVKSDQRDAYGGATNTPVIWTSSDTTVATVQNQYKTNNAVITCVAAGSATITATMGTVTATFLVTVSTAATYDGYSLTVEADQSFKPINQTIQTKTD
jgi:uncharacterized protein YjdB